MRTEHQLRNRKGQCPDVVVSNLGLGEHFGNNRKRDKEVGGARTGRSTQMVSSPPSISRSTVMELTSSASVISEAKVAWTWRPNHRIETAYLVSKQAKTTNTHTRTHVTREPIHITNTTTTTTTTTGQGSAPLLRKQLNTCCAR